MNTATDTDTTDQELFNNSTGGKLVNKILDRQAAEEAALDAWMAECSLPLS